MTDPINATLDQSTVTMFPRLPYKLPTVSTTATIGGLFMRMSGFGINDSIVAALGLGIVVWMGLIYAESFRRYRILRVIFKKYPKGIVWNSVCFYDKKCDEFKFYPYSLKLSKFDNHETDATVVDYKSETGYQNYKFADIDTDFVLRPEIQDSIDRDDIPLIDRHKTLY